MIDIQRILNKLDLLLSKDEYEEAEKSLLFWVDESIATKDTTGYFAISNELIGLYRKTNQKEKAYKTINNLLAYIQDNNLLDNTGTGTAYLNMATAYNNFEDVDKALYYYLKAREIYEKDLSENDARLGGLYNNMASALVKKEQFEEANSLYLKALSIMEINNNYLDQAITYINLVDILDASPVTNETRTLFKEYITKAIDLFNKEDVKRDGYYAFVASKCIPAFNYYGFPNFAVELRKRIDLIKQELK